MRIVIQMEGGLINSIIADEEAEIIVIDADAVEASDDDAEEDIDGRLVWVSFWSTTQDIKQVQRAFEHHRFGDTA